MRHGTPISFLKKIILSFTNQNEIRSYWVKK